MDLHEVRHTLRTFASERNWDMYHSPKNLTMALAAEAAELLEIFQWLTEKESRDIVHSEKEMISIREEVADVFIYLVRLADMLDIDIESAVLEKIDTNRKRYPVALSKDNATKYSKR